MANALVLGGTSAIAHAVARRWAERGDAIVLAGRSAERLETVAQDLRVRGAASVATVVGDLADPGAQEDILARARAALGSIDTALVAYGLLGTQDEAQRDAVALERVLRTNFTSAAAWCERLVAGFEAQGRGTLAVIGSVAGDRGRQSNYVYGSAKGALAIYLDGLRHRLARSAVRVVTIKPGFVDTPMTAEFPKGALWASPDTVAAAIVAAIDRGRPVAYVPGFWRWIMLVVRSVPRAALHRTRL